MERFEGTDEREVTCYQGCELIRDWQKHSIKILQSQYARKILMYFGYMDSVATAAPLPPNKRLKSSKQYLEYADPMISLVTCQSISGTRKFWDITHIWYNSPGLTWHLLMPNSQSMRQTHARSILSMPDIYFSSWLDRGRMVSPIVVPPPYADICSWDGWTVTTHPVQLRGGLIQGMYCT